MCYVRDEQAPAAFVARWVRHIDAALDNREGWPIIELIGAYLYRQSDRLQPEEVVAAVQAAPARNREVMMNLAQKFEQKGLEQGLRQGQRKVLLEAAPRLIRLRFGPPDQRTLDRIGGADLETLERWFGRAMDASTLSELLDG